MAFLEQGGDPSRPLWTVLPQQPQRGLVFLLHGSGDTSWSMRDLAQSWASRLPHVKFMLPSAPHGSWYSRDVSGHLFGHEESRHEILQLLEADRSSSGLSLIRVVFVGFSQGAAMAVWVALQLPCPCGGLVLLNGGAEELWITEAAKQTPVLYCAGQRDIVVTPAATQNCCDRLRHLGLSVTYCEYADLGHDISMEVSDSVLDFLQERLPKSLPIEQLDQTANRPCKVDLKPQMESDDTGTLLDPEYMRVRYVGTSMMSSPYASIGPADEVQNVVEADVVGAEGGSDGGVDTYILRPFGNGEEEVRVPPHRLMLPAGAMLRLGGLGSATERNRRLEGQYCRVRGVLLAEGRYTVEVSGERSLIRVKPRQLWPCKIAIRSMMLAFPPLQDIPESSIPGEKI